MFQSFNLTERISEETCTSNGRGPSSCTLSIAVFKLNIRKIINMIKGKEEHIEEVQK